MPELDRPVEVAEVESLGHLVAPVGGERRAAVAPGVVLGPGHGDARGEGPLERVAELAGYEAGPGRERLLRGREPQVGAERTGVRQADVRVRRFVEEPEGDRRVLILGQEGQGEGENHHTSIHDSGASGVTGTMPQK